MKKRNVLIIFSLFFLHTTTQCMLVRVAQLVATNRKNIIPAIKQHESYLLRDQDKNNPLQDTMKKAVEEELARREAIENSKQPQNINAK